MNSCHNSFFNPLTAQYVFLNFHPLKVVSRWRVLQGEVGLNYLDLTKKV